MFFYWNLSQFTFNVMIWIWKCDVIFKISKIWLTHWGRVTHICVGKLTIIGSDNGLSPGRRQAIIWTNAGILLIGPFGTNFSEILIATETFSFKKIHLKMSSAKWRLFGLGLNELTYSRGWDKMATISQVTFSNAFSWMKRFEFLYKPGGKWVQALIMDRKLHICTKYKYK